MDKKVADRLIAENAVRVEEIRVRDIGSFVEPPISDGELLVIRVVPADAENPFRSFDLHTMPNLNAMTFGKGGELDEGYHLDGFYGLRISTNKAPRETQSLYVVRRNGIIESIGTGFVQEQVHHNRGTEITYARVLPVIESETMSRVQECVRGLAEMKANFPVAIFIALTGVQGCFISHQQMPDKICRFDRDTIHLPPILVDANNQASLKDLVFKSLEVLWQGSGYQYRQFT